MANMEDYQRPLTDLEHGDLPDLVGEAARFVLRGQDKREEHSTALGSANGIASTRDESLEKIVIEPTFSQGGEHEIRNDSYSCRG